MSPSFVCVGDSQLGVATVSLVDQEGVWDRIVDLAIERKVDGVLHGGDLFEFPIVPADVHAAFRRPLARLREADIPMLLIRGNHDGATRPVDALDVFREYPNLIVSQRPEVHTIAGINIVTLPWTSPAGMVAALNGDVSRDAINDEAARLLVKIAGSLLEQGDQNVPRLVPYSKDDGPNILLAHWSISSGALPNGLPLGQLKEPILDWSELDALGFDAVVASHIHAQQRLDDPALGDATLGFYTGSPQQLNFGEKSEHGCWLLDIDPGATGNAIWAEFVPIQSKKFLTVSDRSEARDVQDAIVRVRMILTEQEARELDHSRIRAELMAQGASKVVIEPQIIRAARARSEAITDQLSPVEALSAYCVDQGDEETTAELMCATLTDWIGS
jgi:DNA repair exonuclease SbcCD nuclease subunit